MNNFASFGGLMSLVLFFISIESVDTGYEKTDTRYSEQDARRLELVREYAGRVLDQGKDKWSGQNTPLLADGINVDTGEPVKWRYEGDEFIFSNLANQQNLFRMLTGLSNLTGEEKYKEAAKSSIQYHFDHLASDCGLLRWGGHMFIEMENLNHIGHFDANLHEFKNNFPFYELMWEVDQNATARFIRAFWNAHIYDWATLDMNRHGSWGLEMGDLWDNEFSNPEPFFEGRGLTFINAGSDLIYSAGMLNRFTGEQGPLNWAQRLHGMYVSARHPDTGLGVYQYSKLRPSDNPRAPVNVLFPWRGHGDRAGWQFGPDSEFSEMYGNIFGDMPREGWVIWGGRVKSIYVQNGFMQLSMAEEMGDSGARMLQETADGLRALANEAYDPEQNHFIPMWADGTDLREIAKEIGLIPYGYYCREPAGCRPEDVWSPLNADMEFLMTYARAFRLTGDHLFWETARHIARGLGLGEIGHQPGEGVALNMDADGYEYEEIFALLELYRAAEHPDYLNRARIVADRMIEVNFHHGFFMPSASHVHANYNTLEPLALLTLDAVLRGEPELVPAHVGSRGYIHGRFDGLGRTNDSEAIWSQQRELTQN